MPDLRSLTALLLIAVVACLGVSLFACAPQSTDRSDPEYAATVQALLPAPDPAQRPESQPVITVAATDPSASPTDTPVPAAETPTPPTYTPRPLPTYTPRPVPLPAGETERSQAVPFQAQTLDGSVLTLSDTLGTPTLLAFWAPW